MKQTLEKISKDVTSFIQEHTSFRDWPDCRRLLIDTLVADDPWILALPVLACKAAGGEGVYAIPVAAAWITLVHAANLIDDIQDRDINLSGQFEKPEVALTFAMAWIFAAFQMINSPYISSDSRNRIMTIFANAGFDSSMGQFQDLAPDFEDPDSNDPLNTYWSSVILKSGSICRAGAAAGAAAFTDSVALIEALGDYGRALGVIRQVIDDCRDVWIDAKVSEKRHKLPRLLNSMAVEQRIEQQGNMNPRDKSKHSKSNLRNQASQVLVADPRVPEIITDILLEWGRRALESLRVLEPSKARGALESILEKVMMPK